jgi:hypothetical protein
MEVILVDKVYTVHQLEWRGNHASQTIIANCDPPNESEARLAVPLNNYYNEILTPVIPSQLKF